MTDRSLELKVGVTVTLAIVLLVVGVVWVGQYRLTREGFILAVDFEFVGGLDDGDPVTVSGMDRGKVERIELRPDGVRVHLWLEPDVALDEKAEIAIENVGLMGEKYVSIRRGGSPRPMDVTRVQRGVYRPSIMEVMAEMGEMVLVLRKEIEGLGGLLSAPSGNSVGELMEKLDRTLDELSTVITENRQDLRRAVQDFRAASEDARGLIADARGETETTLSGVGEAVEGIEATTAEVRALVQSLQALVERVDEGEGTLGMLVNDRNLHNEIVRTLRDLEELLADIRENPKKYFGVSVF